MTSNKQEVKLDKESNMTDAVQDSVKDNAAEESIQESNGANPANDMTLEQAAELFAAGTQALALSNYEDAAEKLALAVEIQVNHLGQYAIEVAPTFHLYGKALLAAAVQKNSVLGEKADQVKPNPLSSEDGAASSAAVAGEDPYLDNDEDDLEDDEGRQLDDIEIPLADDLELAWENLDVARLIYSKQESTEHLLELADVHLSLGDVSLESENFDQAVKDYETALKLKLEHAPQGYRELAEAHFKLALAFEYSELNEEAIEHVTCAMDALKKRISLLGSEDGAKGKATETSLPEAKRAEIEELNGFLGEMGSKLADLNTLIEKEDAGEPLVAPSLKPEAVVNDISGLVKKRKTDGGKEPEKKTKLE
ncbi:hypothetical protein HDV03_001602 [Kappamyces sp. JEL0829]|nr:hypothetical protein HDV03_001602 [Kappamyces sp. JEL0829]